MSAEADIGKVYRGKVVTIKEFGAFVEFLPGKDGLVHISELANFRVKKTEDIVKMGDEIWVKCLGVDEKGRVRLSRKAAMADRDKEMGIEPSPEGGEQPPQEGESQQQHQGERSDRGGGDRGDRGGGGYRGDRGDRGGDRRGPRDQGPRRSPEQR
jgi:polyribonucleotide nucleotidyltransferase